MADRPAAPDPSAAPDTGSAAPYPGTPRWVKLLGIAALLVVLLVLVVMLAVGGQHGPGRHVPSGGHGGQTPAIAQGVLRPGSGW
jgi:hypothetical protein